MIIKSRRMKAEHLRLHNIVKVHWEAEHRWCALDFWEGIEFEPIPLTEEWLKRFGFEKDEDGIWEHHQSMWSCEISGDDDSFNFKKIGLDILCPDVLYVHQLQNLYFALTGEELKTDETNQKVNL